MQQPLIYISKHLFLGIILITSALNAQSNDSIISKTDTITEVPKKPVRKGDFFVGVDVFTPALSFFTDRKEFQVMAQYRIYNNWFGVVELGTGKNIYDENGWNNEVKGSFGKIGFNYFISMDKENDNNGFYAGFRVAYAKYKQTIGKYPIRDINSGQVVGYGSLPENNVDAYWVEGVIGARLDLVKNLYIDFSVHPAFYAGGKKDNGFDSKVIPGFGKHSTSMNIPIFWGITYKLF